MEQAHLNPAYLPEGTRVGPWRLLHLLGRGNFGTVYRAEGVEPEVSGLVAALKLAQAPNDERFAREAWLLSHVHHPCVPRFLGHGHWQSPSGLLHPYVAMELLDGLPLYEWARASCPTSRQVLRLFAGLARALEATHAAGGVHRDVKGGNVLVRAKDGRAFLVDFGSCHHQGASTLTWHPFPPGTLAYRPPEAFAHSLYLLKARGPLLPYSPKPADDVFALGVTAWRLVTGSYPPSPEPLDPEAHVWAPDGPGPRPAHELNVRCSSELSAVISRMLSVQPQARSSAGELAEALERAASRAGPEADVPLHLQEARQPEARHDSPPEPATQGPHRRGWSPLAAASLSAALAVGAIQAANNHGCKASTTEQAMAERAERDAGSVGLGDSVLTAPVAPAHVPSGWSRIALDIPAKPFPGQTRPDANGQCSGSRQASINGGCWYRLGNAEKGCPKDLYVYKDECYAPVYPPPRPATSSPTDAADGGAR
jgi:serine/threonine-protein kinase